MQYYYALMSVTPSKNGYPIFLEKGKMEGYQFDFWLSGEDPLPERQVLYQATVMSFPDTLNEAWLLMSWYILKQVQSSHHYQIMGERVIFVKGSGDFFFIALPYKGNKSEYFLKEVAKAFLK